jgi:Dullard-like phosphatase family protein
MQSFDKFLAGSSVDSSMCSMLDGGYENGDLYSQSILVSSMVKEPEDLIDRDLLHLLGYIKRLPLPTEEQIQTKSLEFGEITRYKTLIFDMDETLIHSKLLSTVTAKYPEFLAQSHSNQVSSNTSMSELSSAFEITLPGS